MMEIARFRRALAAATAATTLLLGVAACGSSGAKDVGGSGGLSSTITVVGTLPLTGAASFAGLAAQKGFELAVKEVNEQQFLGEGTKLDLSIGDTKNENATAASLLSAAIANQNVSAVFGSVNSAEAVAQSPLAQHAGMPIIYTQAGSEGVVIGDYTYRGTPLMASYYPIIKQYLQKNDIKSAGVIYTSVSPTLEQVATKTIPSLGLKVTASLATPATTQDFSPAIKQVLDSHPDVVVLLQVGAGNATAMKQLRQAGYTGPVLGNQGAGAGNLKPAGADGAGMVWPVNFNYQQQDPSSQKFAAAYKAQYGDNPLNYAADAYDAAWFLARSIKAAGSPDRAAIKDGLAAEAAKKTSGALGENLTWKDRTLQVPGVVVEWTGSEEKLLYAAKG